MVEEVLLVDLIRGELADLRGRVGLIRASPIRTASTPTRSSSSGHALGDPLSETTVFPAGTSVISSKVV
jgi:hypothetical protein